MKIIPSKCTEKDNIPIIGDVIGQPIESDYDIHENLSYGLSYVGMFKRNEMVILAKFVNYHQYDYIAMWI